MCALEPPTEVLERLVRIEKSTGSACGFLIAGGVVLTCHHVLPTAAAARAAVAACVWDHVVDSLQQPLWTALDERRFRANALLDYAIVGMSGVRSALLPTDWPLLAATELDEEIVVVEPSSSDRRRGRLTRTRVTGVTDGFVCYGGPTRYGSSGAPIFNRQWHLVAMHCMQVQPVGPEESPTSKGVSVQAITADLQALALDGSPGTNSTVPAWLPRV